jgi:hypothetical protein
MTYTHKLLIIFIITIITITNVTAGTPPAGTPPAAGTPPSANQNTSVASYISSILPSSPSGWTILSFAQTPGGVISPDEQRENAQISCKEVRDGG